ncbi:hypothetical protein AXK57_14900 [Tsukamurella pulmonis]|nr:hypothetical protein AXK57_14900 [Tsukamurella pulmonis]
MYGSPPDLRPFTRLLGLSRCQPMYAVAWSVSRVMDVIPRQCQALTTSSAAHPLKHVGSLDRAR